MGLSHHPVNGSWGRYYECILNSRLTVGRDWLPSLVVLRMCNPVEVSYISSRDRHQTPPTKSHAAGDRMCLGRLHGEVLRALVDVVSTLPFADAMCPKISVLSAWLSWVR